MLVAIITKNIIHLQRGFLSKTNGGGRVHDKYKTFCYLNKQFNKLSCEDIKLAMTSSPKAIRSMFKNRKVCKTCLNNYFELSRIDEDYETPEGLYELARMDGGSPEVMEINF